MIDELEAKARIDMLEEDPVSDLERSDLGWLAFIDQLEAYAFMMVHAPHLRHGDGWPDARDRICSQYGWLTDARDVSVFCVFLSDLDSRALRGWI